jgi:hypothetical protein
MEPLDRTAVVTGIAGFVTPLLLAIGTPQPLRAVAAFAVVAFIPGFAFARLADLGDETMLLLVAVALSLALTVAVSTTLLYLTSWSWLRCVYVLGAATVVASAVRLGRFG